jgi:hypothetical protein
MEGPDTKKANKEYILKNKKKRTLERKRGKRKKKAKLQNEMARIESR